jgi:hypothetical protein
LTGPRGDDCGICPAGFPGLKGESGLPGLPGMLVLPKKNLDYDLKVFDLSVIKLLSTSFLFHTRQSIHHSDWTV